MEVLKELIKEREITRIEMEFADRSYSIIELKTQIMKEDSK